MIYNALILPPTNQCLINVDVVTVIYFWAIFEYARTPERLCHCSLLSLFLRFDCALESTELCLYFSKWDICITWFDLLVSRYCTLDTYVSQKQF